MFENGEFAQQYVSLDELYTVEIIYQGDGTDHVPVGIYAKEALTSLGAWDAVNPLLARTNNVRSGMALVEREEAPLGIVYGSDAVASQKVKVVGIFPADSHKPVEYPMAIVKDQDNKATRDYYEYLKTPAASEVFKRYGFTPR